MLSFQHQLVMEVLLEQPLLLRSTLAWGFMLAAAVCCWWARQLPPGLPRLLATLPVLLVIHCCPLMFSFSREPLTATAAAFLCVRLTSGKVVAFCLGRGALTLSLTFTQFVAVMLAPFMPAEVAANRVVVVSNSSRGRAGGQGANTAATSQDTLKGLQFKGVPHLQTIWQRVAPVQRFSIDSSTGDRNRGSSPSPTGSPRIAAVRARQDLGAAAAGRAGSGGGQEGSTVGTSSGSIEQKPTMRHRLAHGATAAAASSGACAADFKPPTANKAHASPSEGLPGLRSLTANNGSNSRRTLAQPANLLLNAAVCAAFLVYCCHSRAALVAVVLRLGGMWVMWRAMQVLMQAASRPAHALGMTLAPHFINPFASTSLTDFWARRWNITQGLVVRFYVYEPIIQGCLVAQQPRRDCTTASTSTAATSMPSAPVANGTASQLPAVALSTSTSAPSAASALTAPPPPPAARGSSSAAVAPLWRRQVAAAATFLVSGLEHELFLWYLLRCWGWQWMAFFSLQGLLLALEGRVKKGFRARGLQLVPFVSHLAVLLVLGLTADAFFWPPLLQPGIVGPLLEALPPQLRAWPAGALTLTDSLQE